MTMSLIRLGVVNLGKDYAMAAMALLDHLEAEPYLLNP